MQLRKLGRTDLDVSVLGFGGAEIGFQGTSNQAVDAMLGAALEMGLNVIDTAAMYADSEAKIGNALRGRRNRCFVFTKCGRHASRMGLLTRARRRLDRALSGGRVDPIDEWTPSVLLRNIEQSLRRLKTDWIDVMHLHTCSEEILRRGAAIETLQRARQAGKVRYIGYSGDGSAARYAVECGQFDVLQTSVSFADQEALDELLPRAAASDLGVVAKRPLANGLWRGARPESVQNHAYWDRLQALRYDSLEGPRTFATALRFVLTVPGVHTAIVGTTRLEHLRQNAEAANQGPLDGESFARMRRRWREVSRPDWVAQT